MTDHGMIWRYQAEPLGVFLFTFTTPLAIGWDFLPWWAVAWSLIGLTLEVLPVSRWYLHLRDEGRLNL